MLNDPHPLCTEKMEGVTPIFSSFFSREPHKNIIFTVIFALFFGKLHKGTSNYTRRGDKGDTKGLSNVFKQMAQVSCTPDSVSYTVAIDASAKAGISLGVRYEKMFACTRSSTVH